jgi:hypothetical protein
MKLVNDILQHIAYSIANNEYVWTDQERIAIKDNGHFAGEWSDLYISANAFLNTNGGNIIIGIKDDEDNNRYVFNGFDDRNGPKLQTLVHQFTDTQGNAVDVTEYIHFEKIPFETGEVMALQVDALPESLRPVCYKGYAYQRSVSGDLKIPGIKINQPETEAEQVVPEPPAPVEEPSADKQPDAPAAPSGEENQAAFQKAYSAELINIFGTDYISLDPELKLMLSYIYERGLSADKKHPEADEISDRLWQIKNREDNKIEQELHRKKIKKALFLLEKNDMVIRIKAQYRINRDYVVVRNLFN